MRRYLSDCPLVLSTFLNLVAATVLAIVLTPKHYEALRTPDEVREILAVPVLAALPMGER